MTTKDRDSDALEPLPNVVPTSASGPGDPVEDVELLGGQIKNALAVATRGTVLSSIPVLGPIFDWVERFKQASREKKLKVLLREYTLRFQSIDDAVSKLRSVLGSRAGQTVFSKIVQILDNGGFDDDWIKVLANTLRNISDEDIDANFERLAYALSQIDRLSPQALVLLSKYEAWKNVSISGTTTTSGQTVSGDWDIQVSNFLSHHVSITDDSTKARMRHSFRDLYSAGMIVLEGEKVKLTSVGAQVHHITL